MKQPKKLLREQKEVLSKAGLDANNFMLVSDTYDKRFFTIIHKQTKEILNINYNKPYIE